MCIFKIFTFFKHVEIFQKLVPSLFFYRLTYFENTLYSFYNYTHFSGFLKVNMFHNYAKSRLFNFVHIIKIFTFLATNTFNILPFLLYLVYIRLVIFSRQYWNTFQNPTYYKNIRKYVNITCKICCYVQ